MFPRFFFLHVRSTCLSHFTVPDSIKIRITVEKVKWYVEIAPFNCPVDVCKTAFSEFSYAQQVEVSCCRPKYGSFPSDFEE
jgi:hypothetical protein